MTGITTKKFSTKNAQTFVDEVKLNDKSYFVFAGNPVPWNDENNPINANSSLNSYEHQIYKQLIFGKRVNDSDVSVMLPRYEWTSNTFYPAYDKDDVDLYTKQFFVYNSLNRSVYKVINNLGTNSTVRPSIVSNKVFTTSDGYTWKYMYTVSSQDDLKFTSNTLIPYTANQDVINAAIPGSIDAIKVEFGGVGWATFHTGTLQNVVNTQAVVVGNTASSNNNFYKNSSIYLKSGQGSGQKRTIIDYNGLTKTVIVDSSFDLYNNISLSNVVGTFYVGDTVFQNTINIPYGFSQGYIQPGDTLSQTNTNATGLVLTNNTTHVTIRQTSTQTFLDDLPIDGNRGYSLGTGTVTVNTTSNTVTGVSTSFVAGYSAGQYIKIGNSIRRITNVTNNTSLSVSSVFDAVYNANVHYKVLSAFTPLGYTYVSANGVVKSSDLNAVELSFNLTQGNFQLGELITQSGSSTNGVISYISSNTLTVSNIEGPGFGSFPISGITSNAIATVSAVYSTPNITLSNPQGTFILGLGLTSSTGGTANVTNFKIIPNQLTEYVISPNVVVEGDGSYANAYCIVNTASQSISSVVVYDSGVAYTEATVSISANNLYGNSAVLTAKISPISGHGYNPPNELGSNTACVTVDFDTSPNESYNIPGYGSFRQIGLLHNPLYRDVFLSTTNYTNGVLTINNPSGSFLVDEVVTQSNATSTIATGIVTASNTSKIHLKQLQGAFSNTSTNTTIRGLTSSVTANLQSANINYFYTLTSNQVVTQETTGASGLLVSANTSTVRLTNVEGVFKSGFNIQDPSTNSYSSVTAIRTANNQTTLSFDNFNQLARVTLSSNSAAFIDNEELEFRTIINNNIGRARVYNTTNELDLTLSSPTTSFLTNEFVTQGLGTSAIVRHANSTFIKLTNVEGNFTTTANLNGQTSGATSVVSAKLPVLVMYNVTGTLAESADNYIIGSSSNAVGYCSFSNTITYPNMVNNSGTVTYIENITPVTKTAFSRERIRMVVNF